MPTLAAGLVKDLWNKATQEKSGIKIKMPSLGAAQTLRARLHSVRAKARRAAASIQGTSIDAVELEWDNFAVSIREAEGQVWLHLEPDALLASGLEIQNLKGERVSLEDPLSRSGQKDGE
jgi:hypothetical protein